MIPTENFPTRRMDGENLVLLPYTPSLVPIYHGWMQSPELLELTGSEPLTLEQEYINQESWSHDPTKYCFIVHSRRPVISFRDGPGIRTPFGIDYTLASEEEAEALKKPVVLQDEDEESVSHTESTTEPTASPTASSSTEAAAASSASAAASASATADAAAATTPSSTSSDSNVASTAAARKHGRSGSEYPLTPIGDVNLFLYPDFNLQEYGISGGGCEIEVMIAEPAYRRRGLGLEAVRLLMEFSAIDLGVERFVVKVLASNEASINLFQRRLGFRLIEYVECFDEMVLFKDTSVVEPLRPIGSPDEGADSANGQADESQLAAPMAQLHMDETSSSAPARTIQDLD